MEAYTQKITFQEQLVPTYSEVCNSIKILQQKYPNKYHLLINKLYLNLFARNIIEEQGRDRSIQVSVFKDHIINEENALQNENNSLNDRNDQALSLQGIQKEAFQIFKARPTKYEVQEQFQRMKEKKLLNISGQVYKRFSQFQNRQQYKNSLRKMGGQNEQNLIRLRQWKAQTNKQYRIYANKVACRFHSKQQQLHFYQKRLMAKTFSERGFRLDRVKQIYSQKMSALNPEGKRRKIASYGLVVDTYRRLQLFLKENMNKNICPLTSQEVKYLYPVMLKAHQKFTASEYDCFRRFVKVTFDLGSVSIYQEQAIQLFKSIQFCLKQKIQQGFYFQDEIFYPLPVKNIPLRDIYAPKRQGGYEQLIEIDTDGIQLDLNLQEQLIKQQEIQFINELIQQENRSITPT